MFKLLFLKFLYNLSSERVIQEAVLEKLLHEMVSQAIEKGLIESKTLILNPPHTRNQDFVKTPIGKVSKNKRQPLYRYIPKIKDSVPPKWHSTALLEEEVTYTQKLIIFSNQYSDQHMNNQRAIEKLLDLLKDETYQTILSV